MPFFGDTSIVGLDIGSGMLKAVELRNRDGRLVAERAGIAPMPGGAISGGAVLDPPAVAECIRAFCRDQGFRAKRVAVAVSGKDVFLTRLKVERAALEAPAAAVREEFVRLGRPPLETTALDFQVLDNFPQSKWADVLVVATPAADVQRLQELLERAGKTAAVVDSVACALANAFQVNYEPMPSQITALLHLGAATMTACILRGSTPLVAKDLILAPTPVPREPDSLLDRIAVELERVLEVLDEIADDHPLEPRSSQIQRLLLSGGAARQRGLQEVLRSRIGLPFEEMNPFLKIDFKGSDDFSRLVWDHVHCMPVAVGLALRGLEAP